MQQFMQPKQLPDDFWSKRPNDHRDHHDDDHDHDHDHDDDDIPLTDRDIH